MLPPNWQVPEAIRIRLGQRVGRQRALVEAGQALLVLHEPPKGTESARQPRLFWRNAEGSWDSSHHGTGPESVIRHIGEFDDLVEKYDRQLGDAKTPRHLFDVLESLARLHRTIRHLHQALQEGRQGLPSARELIDMRDAAYELERRADLLHSDANTTLQFVQTQRADQQASDNHQMTKYAHRLNILAAFFFPLATLAAILGSGLPHGLERLPAPWTWVAFVGLGLGLGFALQLLMNRR